MPTKLKISLITFLAAFTISASAQIFPVQATTQLTPPYSLYLSDYVTPGSERLALNVFLGDITRPTLDVKFKLRIEGQGVLIETKPEYNPPPTAIQSGVPMRLISSDLAEYFNPNNLNFTGISRAEYERAGKLPEGAYQFCFEVLEYNRGLVISNKSCGVAWMILNDPPLINLPRQDEKIRPLEPQNIVFQWTPRHTGSPNSAFVTDYELEIVEVWPSDRDPNDAILSSPRILKTTTQSTTFIYGPAEVPLVAGRRYAFRVKAKAIVGIDELDVFKNNGYSQVFTFTYGDACGIPTDVIAEPLSSRRIKVGWGALPKHSIFNVRYREQGTTDWFTDEATIDEATINSLKASTVYEYQVSGICGAVNGEYSDVATVKTLEEEPMEYSCGLPLETFDLDPSKLTGSLKVGDIINAGDFDVKVTKVSGSSGIFTGEGNVVMPMMNKVKVNVTFDGITVVADGNSGDYRMVKGVMKVTGGKVEVIPEGLMNLVDKLDEALDLADSALNLIETYLPREGPDPSSFAADTLIVIDKNIISVVPNNETGEVIIVTSSGTTTLPKGTNYAIKDSNGKGYVVDKNGNVTKTTAEEAEKAAKREYNLVLEFENGENAKHGFDQWKGNELLKFTYETLNDSYTVPWKAIHAEQGDVAKAKLSDSSLDPTKVRFEFLQVSGTASYISNNEWNIQLTSGTDGKVIAYYPAEGDDDKEQILGKMNVQGFSSEPTKLMIVVDQSSGWKEGTTPENELKTQISKIYGQAAMDWQITFQYASLGIDDSFDAGGTSILTNYTADMRRVINDFGPLQPETMYLFVIGKPNNLKPSVRGFTPREKQVGFIYRYGDETTQGIGHTMAHELGHGAFSLRHTFLEFNGLGEGATDNLMDYKDDQQNNHLMRHQWVRIHDPVNVIGLFESDEEGEDITYRQDVEWIVEIYSPYFSNQFLEAKTLSEQKKAIANALGSKMSAEQLKYLSSIKSVFPKTKDGKIPFGIMKHYPNAKIKAMYVYLTKKEDGKIIAVDKPHIFKSTYPADLSLHTGEFDNIKPVPENKNEIVLEYRNMAYDFVWQTMTERSWTDRTANWLKEAWSYDNVELNDAQVKQNMELILNTDILKYYNYTLKEKIRYSYEFKVEGKSIPIAIYVLVEDPNFSRLNFLDYTFDNEKPYRLVGFHKKGQPENPVFLIQIKKDFVGLIKDYFFKNDILDDGTFLGDAVPNMEIVPSGTYGKQGGRFGCNRTSQHTIKCDRIKHAYVSPRGFGIGGGGWYHSGIDIKASLNTDLHSILKGRIVSIDENDDSNVGYTIVIKSEVKGQIIYLKYCHLNSFSTLARKALKEGSEVRQGEIIGKTGNTGNARSITVERYHVHIEASTDGVFYGGKTRVDPELFFKSKFGSDGESIK